jgi:hypothetical protein
MHKYILYESGQNFQLEVGRGAAACHEAIRWRGDSVSRPPSVPQPLAAHVSV